LLQPCHLPSPLLHPPLQRLDQSAQLGLRFLRRPEPTVQLQQPPAAAVEGGLEGGCSGGGFGGQALFAGGALVAVGLGLGL